jgi:hypothetical protein
MFWHKTHANIRMFVLPHTCNKYENDFGRENADFEILKDLRVSTFLSAKKRKSIWKVACQPVLVYSLCLYIRAPC